MARNEGQHQPLKVGTSKLAKADSKEPLIDPGEEIEEDRKGDIAGDVKRAKRKGQSGMKGRPLPSRMVAVKRPGKQASRG